MPNLVDFYVDVPEYRASGMTLFATTHPSATSIVSGFKRIKFTVNLPDDVFKIADVSVVGIIEAEEDDSIPF